MTPSSQAWKPPKSPSAGAPSLISHLQPGQKIVPGIETRGIADHQFLDSIYFRDPNGYVIELTAKRATHDAEMDPATNGARRKLDSWQSAKAG